MSNVLAILANDTKMVSYRPEFNSITGSITASILLSQCIYWSVRSNNNFYKFRGECNHSQYKKGDSWSEELGISKCKVDKALKTLEELGLITWKTDYSRLTYYSLNLDVLEEKLTSIYGEAKTDFTPPKINTKSKPKKDKKAVETFNLAEEIETNQEKYKILIENSKVKDWIINYFNHKDRHAAKSKDAWNICWKGIENMDIDSLLRLIQKVEDKKKLNTKKLYYESLKASYINQNDIVGEDAKKLMNDYQLEKSEIEEEIQWLGNPEAFEECHIEHWETVMNSEYAKNNPDWLANFIKTTKCKKPKNYD